MRTLTILSVPHPLAGPTPRQREMAWYQLFFQFEGIAEASITDQDWAPTLGIWSDGDRYLDGARVRASGDLVAGPWRYEEIAGATHWIPLDAPDRLTELLLGWFDSPR